MDGSANGSPVSFLIAFRSTHAALAAQKALECHNPHMVPTPRAITAACGMALKLSVENEDRVKEMLGNAKLDREESDVYRYDGGVYRLLES